MACLSFVEGWIGTTREPAADDHRGSILSRTVVLNYSKRVDGYIRDELGVTNATRTNPLTFLLSTFLALASHSSLLPRLSHPDRTSPALQEQQYTSKPCHPRTR